MSVWLAELNLHITSKCKVQEKLKKLNQDYEVLRL